MPRGSVAVGPGHRDAATTLLAARLSRGHAFRRDQGQAQHRLPARYRSGLVRRTWTARAAARSPPSLVGGPVPGPGVAAPVRAPVVLAQAVGQAWAPVRVVAPRAAGAAAATRAAGPPDPRGRGRRAVAGNHPDARACPSVRTSLPVRRRAASAGTGRRARSGVSPPARSTTPMAVRILPSRSAQMPDRDLRHVHSGPAGCGEYHLTQGYRASVAGTPRKGDHREWTRVGAAAHPDAAGPCARECSSALCAG
jgi:hypothetical protein